MTTLTVDVHAHVSPPHAAERFPMPPSLLDVEGMIERKLAAGIELSIVGSPVGAGAMVPIEGIDNYDQPDAALAVLHDWLADLVAAHPAHLRAWAYVNPFGSDRQLAAAAETVRDDRFVGFIVNSSIRDEYLGAPRAEAFFAMVDEADVPVFVHPPARPVGTASLPGPALVEQVGRFYDTATGVASVILGGWLERYPRLRLLAASGGGPLGLLAERLDRAERPEHHRRPGGGPPPGAVTPTAALPHPPSRYLERVWVDTAVANVAHLLTNLSVFGPGRMVLGTDSPPIVPAVDEVLGLVRSLPIDDHTQQEILGGNACRLLSLAPTIQLA
jgi:aminocarboxymuconate-semialdehyde decarboxylase